MLVLAFLASTAAHAQVETRLLLPPSLQLLPSDPWNCSVDNNSGQRINAVLQAEIFDGTRNLLMESQSEPLSLNMGNNLFSSSGVKTAHFRFLNNSYADAVRNVGQFPSGTYVVCLKVLDYSSRTVLAEHCVESKVEILAPPRLLHPFNGATVEEPFPVFNWLPPASLRQGQQVRYSFVLVEVFEGQNHYDAIVNNIALHKEADLAVNVLMYPATGVPLSDKKKYAWQVEAFSAESFSLGKTEVWWFQLKTDNNDTLKKKPSYDGYFFVLDNINKAGYYTTPDYVRFRYMHGPSRPLVSATLYGQNNKPVPNGNLPLLQPFADDRYVVDLTALNSLKPDSYYFLKIEAIDQTVHNIRIKYTPKQ